MSRSAAREIAFKLIFEYVFNKEENNELVQEYIQDNFEEAGYIQEVYHGVIAHFDELCGIVKEKSVGFSFDRIFKVDLAILLVALYEIKYMTSIPNKVSINEALNLAKAYSTEKSNKFINGILASVV